MCNLCSNDASVVKKEREILFMYADDMRALAHMYEQMANGLRKPHDKDDMALVTITAKGLLKHLVYEYT